MVSGLTPCDSDKIRHPQFGYAMIVAKASHSSRCKKGSALCLNRSLGWNKQDLSWNNVIRFIQMIHAFNFIQNITRIVIARN
jgi:hypothetical protein